MRPSPRNSALGPPGSQTQGDHPARTVTPALLRRHPVPLPQPDGDKEQRGRVLVVGGSPQTPGALLLAGTAALRAGAGKLQLATGRTMAPWLATSLPEARVFALPETPSGALSVQGIDELLPWVEQAGCVLLGPGMIDEEAATAWTLGLLPRLHGPMVVLDAAPFSALRHKPALLHPLEGRAVLTPHAGEAASLLGVSKDAVRANPLLPAREAAAVFKATVVLKGDETVIAAPDGRLFRNRVGNVGLATSGSGDVLSGIIAGLVARGAEAVEAAIWAVYLHAAAGDRLAGRVGPLGFLAGELPAEIPGLMHAIQSSPARSGRKMEHMESDGD